MELMLKGDTNRKKPAFRGMAAVLVRRSQACKRIKIRCFAVLVSIVRVRTLSVYGHDTPSLEVIPNDADGLFPH